MLKRSNKNKVSYLRFILIVILISASTSFSQSFEVIEPGQKLTITVANHTEFSAELIVYPDGTVDYPLLNGISIAGFTPTDVKDLLIPIFISLNIEPEIFITAHRVQTIRFYVQGMVNNPGTFTGVSPINLQQAILMAGGNTQDADLRKVHILRKQNGNRTDIEIDLAVYYLQDSLELSPEILDEDIIVLARGTLKRIVQVIGAVNNPGQYVPEHESNVYDMIRLAGGISDLAEEKKVILISNHDGSYTKKTINIKDVFESRRNYENLPQIFPGDIIIVKEKKFWKTWDWWIEIFRDVTVVLTMIVLVDRL